MSKKLSLAYLALVALSLTGSAVLAADEKPAPPAATATAANPPTMEATAGTADNTAPAGFTAVFNGKDLAGWKGLLAGPLDNPVKRATATPEDLAAAQKAADENMLAHWKAQAGELAFDGKGRSLATAKDYGDVEMWVSWKIGALGDSGIYLRGSPQVQIWDTADERHGGQVGSGGLYNNQHHPSKPLVVADNPVGQWNTFFIRMIGDRVTVYLNGKLVVDNVPLENYWDRDKPLFPTGQIELQNHSNPLFFKNIYIKEFPRDAHAQK